MMGEQEYQRFTQVLERLASVEGKLDLFIKNNDYVRAAIDKLAERVAQTEAAAKSAHKRMDNFEQTRKEDRESIRWTIGIGVTISGIICSLLTHFFGR